MTGRLLQGKSSQQPCQIKLWVIPKGELLKAGKRDLAAQLGSRNAEPLYLVPHVQAKGMGVYTGFRAFLLCRVFSTLTSLQS